ncbi:MAG: hypothetical protein LBQ15_05970 [Clostridium sp.]|jgi:hypothetical protein|nr:hypothetical protein [Clostridium sp.]
MLGKLIRHEWKATYKFFAVVVLFLAAMTVLGRVSLRTIFGFSDYDGEWLSAESRIALTSLLLYVATLIGVTIGMGIYLGLRFYQSMYSGEGYLTHTLPVHPHKLLLSKLLVGGSWYALMALFVGISGIVLVCSLPWYGNQTLWLYLKSNPGSLDEILRAIYGKDMNLAGIVALSVLQLVVLGFSGTMSLYGAVTLGQLSSRHRIMMAVVCYLGLNLATSFLSSLLVMPALLRSSFFFGIASMASANSYHMAFSLVTAAVLYVVSYLIITRKLNLE